MKTTFDLPPKLLELGKITAAKRRTSLKNIVIEGLEAVLAKEDVFGEGGEKALERLREGYQLGNQPLSREAVHERS